MSGNGDCLCLQEEAVILCVGLLSYTLCSYFSLEFNRIFIEIFFFKKKKIDNNIHPNRHTINSDLMKKYRKVSVI